MGTLREMNIFVRSHLSALEPDQVSAVRVRWEREKRKAAEAPAPKRSRRKVAVPAPAPPAAEARPVRRRRTAAEVAEHDAKAAAEAEEEAAKTAFELEPLTLEGPSSEAVKPALSIDERARLLFKDLPPRADRTGGGGRAGTAEAGRRRDRARVDRGSSADPAACHAAALPADRPRREQRSAASVHPATRATPSAVVRPATWRTWRSRTDWWCRRAPAAGVLLEYSSAPA